MPIAWSGLNLLPTRSSTPLTNLSKQIVWVLHLVITVFLLWSFPNKDPSNTPLMGAFQNVEKYDREILKVSNCTNVLSLPGSRHRINMSTVRPIPNRYLTGWVPRDRYDGNFTMSLQLITFLLTSNSWFLVVQGFPLPACVHNAPLGCASWTPCTLKNL